MEPTTTREVDMGVYPTDAEVRAWRALPRDKQITQLRDTMREAINGGPGDMTDDAIKELGRQRAKELTVDVRTI